jgi:nucleoside phosphorylase
MPDYNHPQKKDTLFSAEYNHVTSEDLECRYCDDSMMEIRDQRTSTEPKIHYGTIASGDDLIKLGAERQRLRNELDILCFEMEAAGLMGAMRCLPVRGIADYADSHKNKAWQRYAAANAAAFAKEVLEVLPSRLEGLREGGDERTMHQSQDIHR